MIVGYLRQDNIPNDIINLCHNFFGKLQVPKIGDYVELGEHLCSWIGQIKDITYKDKKRRKKERIVIVNHSDSWKKDYVTKREFISRVVKKPNNC